MKISNGMDMSKYYKFIFPALAIVVVAGGLVYYEYSYAPQKGASVQEAVRSKVEKFINDNLVQAGTTASIKDIIEEGGLYKITVDVAGHDLTSYVSQDGKTFFPEAIDMDSAENSAGNQNNQPQESKQSAEKADVPEVELFVMSYCPYGLQAEKGMLPVVELLGSKIKFSLKFVDYAMHGEKEIDENLRQYCIEKQGVSKLASYLKCFTDKGDSAACVPVTKIDVGALNTCLAATDAEFKIKEKFEDQNAWIGGRYPPFDVDKDDNVKYGVRGSPTLVVNGAKVSAARDPQSILTAICSGFSNLPDECGQKLSGNAPSPGFGSGTGSNANASCGN